jgi:hypothetical protein
MPFTETRERFLLDKNAASYEKESSLPATEILHSWETGYYLLNNIWQAAVDAAPYVDRETLKRRFVLATVNVQEAIELSDFEELHKTGSYSLQDMEALFLEEILSYDTVPLIEAILLLRDQLDDVQTHPLALDDAMARCFPEKNLRRSDLLVTDCFDIVNNLLGIDAALVAKEQEEYSGSIDLHVQFVSTDPAVQTQMVLQGFTELAQVDEIKGRPIRGVSCLLNNRLAPFISRLIAKQLHIPSEDIFIKPEIRIPDILQGSVDLPHTSAAECILVSYANIKYSPESASRYFLTGEPPPVGILYCTVPGSSV